MSVIVRVEHARQLGYCARGMRRWFELHGLDFGQFIAHGLPAETLLATGDEFARCAVEEAERDGQR